jgi:sarcosine oxidase subunit beta
VIIGGGIVGVSIAHKLASAGMKNVMLLEKELLLGTGSSAASAGIIYHHLPEKVNLQLSRKSLEAIQEFEDEFETKIDFHRDGCIQTAGSPEDMATIASLARELDGMGVDAKMLEPGELVEFFPGMVTEDLLGAIYTPDDGYFDPHGIIQGYAAAARKLGVRFVVRTPVTGLRVEAGRITGVKTPSEIIDTEIVVNAAGPAAADIAGFAGLKDLPIAPFKRQIFTTKPTDIIPPDAPFYFDKAPAFYFRPESGGLLMSIAEMEECPSRALKLDWSSAEILAERATRRLPRLDSIRIMRGWAGLRSMTPDHTAILGPVPEPAGFYLAVGFSGHGVMHAPMTGRIVASMIVDRSLDSYEEIDLAPLRYERFLK